LTFDDPLSVREQCASEANVRARPMAEEIEIPFRVHGHATIFGATK
jgi:hypothetical protein